MNKFSFISVFFAAIFILSAAVGFSQPVFTTTHLDACNASANGSITINVSSATGPTSYNIISGSFNVGPITFTSPVTISGLAGTGAGRTYFVVVSDDNGSTPTTVVVTLYSNVSGTTSATGVTTCSPFNGAIDLTPSGGAAGSGSGSYSYAWTGPSSFTATTQDISGVGPGDYNVTISDANTVCTAVLGPINVSIASPSITLGSIPGVCSGTTTSTLPYSATTGSPNEYTIDWDNTANGAGLADVAFTALPATPISITGIPSVGSTTTFNGTLVARNSGTGCVTAANSISVTVTANVTPSVSVGASPSGPICAGTSVTFTATPTNGGTPTYQWRKNGSNVGTNSNTYTDAALANGDQVDVVMTSSITCVTTPTATSTAITMTVTTPVTPSVTVAASPSGPICVGTSVTFTATPTNGGTPTYQWRKNGSNVGTNSNTYTDATLANGDQVDVVMTTSLTCVTTPTATSTAITMTVTAPVTPSVSIAASPSGPICASTSVTFTATPTNGGTPAYQWRKNGSNVGTNSNTYTDAGLANGDQIDVVMTTSLTCVTTPTATSTAITMTVTAPVTPSVTIAASPNGTICGGTSVTFTATPTNGGTPSYQWRKNGSNVGTNSNTYTDATLANGDQIDVVMTSSISCVTTPTANSNTITMTVTTPVVPSVSIAASPSGPICAGTSVTFTATPTNGGTPNYQWRKNGSNVGSNSNTYTDAALANGDQIDVVMTTSLTCVTTPTANSNTITMTVNTPLVPSVNIAASPNGAICSGTSVTFTATPTNGGTPTYQWKKNGSNVGTNSNTYTDAALANGDQIDVVMTTSLTCVTTPTATSNTITMTVNASVTPLVSIVASPSGAICAGSSVTFTATPTSGGTPTYQWRKNGSNVGTSSSTYTDAALANGDQIDVVMTTSLACATTPTATSNLITMTVNNPVAPLVSIAASPNGTICGGTSVTFTATPTNGGGTPTYQWKKNGSNVGTNSNTYTDATLANGDQIDVVMTTSLSCVTTPTANSNTITMTVTTPLVPSVSVVASPSGAICSGTSVTFTATPTNGGTPAYQWRKNGVNVGTNSNAYTDAALANGDQIDVVMTTSLTCVTSPTATSSAITMTVSTSLTPSVSIAASPAGPICLGTSVTFTATPTNGGTPTYQWTKNGSNVGTNSNTYTDASLTNGDQVNVIMTSSLTCATTPTATTTPITMTVNNPVVPSVSVTASPSGAICAGTSVTFTAAPTNGGTPTYQWRKNGSNVGTNSNTYTDAALANGDQVDVVMTTSLTCVTTPTATSAAITMTVNPLPTATISYSGGPFCATGTVSVTQTGQTGGTYSSSPSGLSIDGTTGQINLAASTGGIYTVTYTFTDGTCPNTTTTGVTVNALPTATISYSGNPFCATGTGNVTQTGQAGGTYSSTGGLVINASTGQIDLVASAPGPYTITYSFTNGTCPNTTTASVTINPLPTAPTGGAVTVCFDNSLHTGTATPGVGESIVWYTAASGGSITVAPSGTAAGTYSAFAAAKNNATNCESATRTQVTVTINALPTITFTAGASTICAGNSSTYTTQAGQNNYVWNVTGGTITSGGAPTDNTATIQWTNSGSVTVNYTDGNTCTAATPTSKSVTVSATPTVAAAGGDQSNVCGTASLSGNTPTTGTGSWGFAPAGNVDGLGNIVTPSSPTSGFNGTPGQSYTLRWTISNGTCTPSTDDVVIAFDPTGVTPSAAGPDQSNCNNGAFTLAGNVPTSGTGQWTIVGSANGAAITAPATNNSTVTGLALGQSVTLRWSITNGASCTSTDDVVLSNNNNPTVASAGSDQGACGTSVTLAANTPTVGTGAWSIVTGTGGSFVDATNPASVFNGTQGNVYKLRWTISNGACAPSTADVNITLDQTPTTAAAGPDILNACGTIALSANNPSVGVGSWSITTNPDNLGSVANASSNVSNFNGSPNVTYVLRWTISNGVCANSTDDVTIQYSPTGPSTANAGPDQTTICGTSATLSGNVPAVGTGQWNFASGGNPDGLGIIADINNQASGFSGTAGISYTLVWTVTNGTCTSTDQVVIKFNAAPTASNAGPDQSLCATSTTLAANAPTTGTGIWSFSSNPDGLGVIADVNNRLSGFTGTIG
ncbi:MAG TPA: hypothetical protein VL728_05290, partial [Cyclobacteriaceae bacterium]|nr:hypothetical protein [Cyclobacteriaceae bacterium]